MQTTREKIKNDHATHYPFIKKLLGYQYNLNIKINEIFNATSHEDHLKNFAAYDIYLLFIYNLQSFQIALNSIEIDMLHPAATSLRTAYEGIPKMFYISLFPNKIGEIAVHEEIHSLTYNEAQLVLQNEETKKLMFGKSLIFSSKNQFEKFARKKYTPSFYRNALYSDQKKKSITSLYSKFSSSTHANLTKNRVLTRYSSTETEIFFRFLECLSYYNIMAFCEGTAKLLWPTGISRQTLEFLNNAALQIGTMPEALYMIPDKDELLQRMVLKSVSD
jgi:hypothetical protein